MTWHLSNSAEEQFSSEKGKKKSQVKPGFLNGDAISDLEQPSE
jgi:hypothetical protein